LFNIISVGENIILNNMNNKIILIIIGIILIVGITGCDSQDKPLDTIPYYFIVIHNEPRNLEENFLALEDLINKANDYNMKLTLMFSPPWADFIMDDPTKKAELENWASQGHEIAGHHHSVTHPGVWDGYTYVPEAEAIKIREERGKSESYLGNLDAFMIEIQKLNPDINSGCMNDEVDKNHLPDAIIYDTCSGFANFGEPGWILSDGSSHEKGKNEYITIGVVNGIERKWLTHTTVMDINKEVEAEIVFNSMDGNVFGAVTHSVSDKYVQGAEPQAEAMMKFMDFLHSKDSTGEKSRTVSEIIEEGLLPEKTISEDVVSGKTQTPRLLQQQGRCGDGICDELEKENPNLCPEDCE